MSQVKKRVRKTGMANWGSIWLQNAVKPSKSKMAATVWMGCEVLEMSPRPSIVESKRGKVRLLRPEELPADWDPATDPRLTAWEVVHHLIRALAGGGEGAAAGLVAKLGAKAEIARELAYRLYTLCERKKRAAEALAYNGLVQSWPEITRLAQETPVAASDEQVELF